MIKRVFALFIVVLFISDLTAQIPIHISIAKLKQIEKKYGKQARNRVLLWDKMLTKAQKKRSVLEKLKIVNDFFNKIRYARDISHWKKADYWASPFEFLGTGAGDCEDYAIAKYFTLRELGIPDKRLRITYVKLSQRGSKYDAAHMVLNYYYNPTKAPIVLDNVNKRLTLATKRHDIKPVYSFNAVGLWKAQNKGKSSVRIGNNRIKNWKSIMERI